MHYLDGANGVKDFDVYTFFAALPDRSGAFNCNPRQRDYGQSKFGRNPDDDPARFTGRRVDLFWRTLDTDIGSDPAEVVLGDLREPRVGSTPWHLAQKAVVLLCPEARIGEVVWPIDPTAALRKD